MTSNSNYSLENNMYCQKFSKIKEIKTDPECSFKSYLNNFFAINCVGKKSCNFTIPTYEIKQNCTSSPKDEFFYFSYNCYDEWINGENVIDRSSFSFVVVVLDVCSILCVLFCLVLIPFSQQNTHKDFKKEHNEISDFTLHFTDLGLDQKIIYKELNDFIKHLNKIKVDGKTNEDENYGIIYDLNYPVLTDKKLELVSKQNNKILKIINGFKSDNSNNNNDFDNKKPDEKEIKIKQINIIEKIQAQNNKFLKKISDHKKINLYHVNDIYVTFNNLKIKNQILKKLNVRWYCWYLCSCDKDSLKSLTEKWLTVEEADQPSNVIWPNIPVPLWKIWIFKTISFIIALIVILASFGIVIGNKYAQREIDDKFNSNVDCNFIEYTQEEVIKEYNDMTMIGRNKVKSYCFCLNTLISNGYTETKEITLPETGPLCEKWLEMFLYSQSLMVGTFIFVPLVNIILSIILELLTQFERNKTESINASSNMWKAFLLQLINTAIVILVVNIYIQSVYDWDPSFPLFTGWFTDFQPLWYKHVGTTIIFYMIINIFSPHAQPLFMLLWKRIIKKYVEKKLDKGIKYQRYEYYDILLGPEFNIGLRYAQILTTIFVTLIYSSGMPILYVCCFANLIGTYWTDKLLIHKLYRYPPKIDYYITNLFNIILLIGVIIHFCFGIWSYSNPEIFKHTTNNQTINALSIWVYNLFTYEENSFSQELAFRITYSYNIICLVFLCLIVIYFILKLLYMFVIPKGVFSKIALEPKKNDIYTAISVKGLYQNHQWRKAHYYKIKNSENENVKNNKELYDFYLKMIENDRKKIIQILKKVYDGSKSLGGLTVKNFDNKFDEYKKNSKKNSEDQFIKFIQTLNSEYKKEKTSKKDKKRIERESKTEDKLIKTDYSYHIYQFPEFRDALYYEYCLAYVRKHPKKELY